MEIAPPSENPTENRELKTDLPDSRPLNAPGRGVALLNLPFNNIHCPSTAIGILKAVLAQHGYSCDDYYFNLDFAELIGFNDYTGIQRFEKYLCGDYIFSGLLFGDHDPSGEYYTHLVHEFDNKRELAAFVARAQEIRNSEAGPFLQRLVRSHSWDKYKVVGITSTYNQHFASLAFARLLGERYPQVPVVIGGFNTLRDMGIAWLNFAPCVDYVCTGEGENALIELLKALEKQAPPSEPVVNMAFRAGGRILTRTRIPDDIDMNALPVPDYDTYYARIREIRLHETPEWDLHTIPIEGARGCWQGEKKPCAFCGGNIFGQKFRVKDPGRVYREIVELSRRYEASSFQFVDSMIDRNYLHTLFKRLAEEKSDLNFYIKMKPTLDYEELRYLARGGCNILQPGIESLCTPALKCQNKGATGLQNIFFLKWSRYFSISVHWNLLSGYYGEKESHYRQQMKRMRLIHHLTPPVCRLHVTLDRESEMFRRHGHFDISSIKPHPLYKNLMDDKAVDIRTIAKVFANAYPDNEALMAAYRETDSEIERWKQAIDSGATLTYRWSPAGFVLVEDRRLPHEHFRYYYKSPMAELFILAGDRICTAAELRQRMAEFYGTDLTEDEIKDFMKRFISRKLAVSERNQYLTLALPENKYSFQ